MAPKSWKQLSKSELKLSPSARAAEEEKKKNFAVIPGPGIPSKFCGPPWQIPADAHPRAKWVNQILNYSISLQRGTMPGFLGWLVGDNKPSIAVCGLVRSYLNAVLDKGLAEMTNQVNVAVGVYRWNSDTKDVGDTYGIPYVWLDVLGNMDSVKTTDHLDPRGKMPTLEARAVGFKPRQLQP